ncbi:MAG: hypothetical protein IPJ61_20640 [Tessaracoccus sp.]|uniref:hypothetical protein n=1 Tax=Tessaracoccus sp. TaxID=1971211 RepID=UPI001EB832CE|nr:hypothetical protein [Tessaracoccus sp.]MBK7823397.1 hypothetical protein [Tessaracoccus sp.]
MTGQQWRDGEPFLQAFGLWCELDLVVRRYQIGEAIAQGRNVVAPLLISEYVDRVAVTIGANR